MGGMYEIKGRGPNIVAAYEIVAVHIPRCLDRPWLDAESGRTCAGVQHCRVGRADGGVEGLRRKETRAGFLPRILVTVLQETARQFGG